MSPRQLVRRFPLMSFVFLACLVGWKSHIEAYLTGGSGSENLPLGPLVAAIIVVSCQGREELRTWWARIRSWRAAPSWYLLAILAPATVSVLLVLINRGFGAPLPTSGLLADLPQMLGTFVIMLVFVGIGEEAGWMAFAAPLLLRRHGFVVAWALAATMRTFWHLPMMINGELSWYLGIVGNVAFTMVMLLVFRASNGQWWLVAVWHAALNATGGLGLFRMATGDDRARLEILLGVVYTIVAVAGYLLWLRRMARPEAAPSTTTTLDLLQHSTSGGRDEA
jgi:membrane protease YdiL (CAAX protease family)